MAPEYRTLPEGNPGTESPAHTGRQIAESAGKRQLPSHLTTTGLITSVGWVFDSPKM